jgi:hypothetical protein
VNGGEQRRRRDRANHGGWAQEADTVRVTTLGVPVPVSAPDAKELLVNAVSSDVGMGRGPAFEGRHRASQHPPGPLSRAVYLEVGNNAGVVVGGSATRGRTTGYRR